MAAISQKTKKTFIEWLIKKHHFVFKVFLKNISLYYVLKIAQAINIIQKNLIIINWPNPISLKPT